jgi:hypothetical protein
MSSMVAGSMRGSEVRLDIDHNLAGAEATAISFMSGWGHENGLARFKDGTRSRGPHYFCNGRTGGNQANLTEEKSGLKNS